VGSTSCILIRIYKLRKLILSLETWILCFVKFTMCWSRKSLISLLINKNFGPSNIHFRINNAPNLTITFRHFNFRKINFCFRWNLIITVTNRRNIGFVPNRLNTRFSYLETPVHFGINIGHFIILYRASFRVKGFFASRWMILVQEAKETLMMIWICIFVYNSKTVANSSRSLCFHHAIAVVNFVSIEKFFPAAVIELNCFTNQAMISVWKTNSTRALFVDQRFSKLAIFVFLIIHRVEQHEFIKTFSNSKFFLLFRLWSDVYRKWLLFILIIFFNTWFTI